MDGLPWPAYLSLSAGEVAARADRALWQLARDEYELAARFADEFGLTRLDRRSRASGLKSPAVPAPAGT